MRLLLFLPVLLLTTSIGHSYAQTHQGIAVIYGQIVVRDSNGNLVSYLELERITVSNVDALNTLIDKNPDVFQQKVVTSGDRSYDLIKATNTVVHSSATVVSQEFISTTNGNNTIALVTAPHDGYPVVAGDKVTTYWTILRLAS